MGEIESGVAVGRDAGCTTVRTVGSLGMRAFRGCSSFVAAFSRVELARRRIPDDRIQPVDNVQTSARMLAAGYRFECWSNTDETTDNREERQNCQRHPHRWW